MPDTLPNPAPADSPALIPAAEPKAHATLITTAGRPVRLFREGERHFRLAPPGRAQALRFDAYQLRALRDAIDDALTLPTGYLFERGQGR